MSHKQRGSKVSQGREARSKSAACSTAIARRNRFFIVAAILVSAIVSSSQAQNPTPNAELPAGAMQAKATAACLECHEARIILQQRLSQAAWTKEVDKMTKWGATYDPADRDALIDYLSANFPPDKPSFEAPRTTAEKSRPATKH